MAATVNINHTIDASSLASQITEGIKAGLSAGFGDALNKMVAAVSTTPDVDRKPNPISTTVNGVAVPPPPASKYDNNAASPDKLASTLSTLSTGINKLVSSMDTLATIQKTPSGKSKNADTLAGVAQLSAPDRKSLFDELNNFKRQQNDIKKQSALEMMDMYDERRKDNRYKNIGMGLITGAGMAAMYQSNNWGKTAGYEAQSINSGANSYNTFLNSSMSKYMDNQNQVGMMTVAGVAGGAAMINPLLGLGVAAAGATANYFRGERTEKQKAYNELALNQDLASYRLQAYGISRSSGMGITASGGMFGSKVDVPLTKLQEYMLNTPGYGGYMTNISDVMSSTRLDVAKSMNTEQQAKYVKDVTKLSQITGASTPELAAAIGQLSSATKQTPADALNRTLSNTVQFGGNPISNINKIVGIMQNSGMGYDQAEYNTNRYQNNEPMLQQKIAQSMVSPTNQFSARMYEQVIGKMTGIKAEDIPSNYRDLVNKSKYASPDELAKLIPKTQLMEQYAQAAGVNLFASDVGTNNGVPFSAAAGGMDNITETPAQQKMLDMISDALKGINTVSIEAQVVNLNGSINSNGGASGDFDKFSSVPKNIPSNMKDLTDNSNYKVPAITASYSETPPIVPYKNKTRAGSK
jgi:hypothetical protein